MDGTDPVVAPQAWFRIKALIAIKPANLFRDFRNKLDHVIGYSKWGLITCHALHLFLCFIMPKSHNALQHLVYYLAYFLAYEQK